MGPNKVLCVDLLVLWLSYTCSHDLVWLAAALAVYRFVQGLGFRVPAHSSSHSGGHLKLIHQVASWCPEDIFFVTFLVQKKKKLIVFFKFFGILDYSIDHVL